MKEFRIQKFDGRQPIVTGNESREVLGIVKREVGLLFEKHAPFVDKDESDGVIRESLELEAKRPDNGRIAIDIQRAAESANVTPYTGEEVRISAIQPDGKSDLLTHIYSADGEGIVRRHDIDLGRIVAGDTFEGQTITNMTTGEQQYVVDDPTAVVDTYVERLQAYNQTRQLAKEVGINEQPVGKTEINSVFAVAGEAHVKEVTGREIDQMISDRGEVLNNMDPDDILSEAQKAAEIFRAGVKTLFEKRERDGDKADVLRRKEEINNGTWEIFAEQTETEDGTLVPFVGAQWVTEYPDPTVKESSTLTFEEHEGYLFETKEAERIERMGYGISKTATESVTYPAGVEDARKVRNFLDQGKLM